MGLDHFLLIDLGRLVVAIYVGGTGAAANLDECREAAEIVQELTEHRPGFDPERDPAYSVRVQAELLDLFRKVERVSACSYPRLIGAFLLMGRDAVIANERDLDELRKQGRRVIVVGLSTEPEEVG